MFNILLCLGFVSVYLRLYVYIFSLYEELCVLAPPPVYDRLGLFNLCLLCPGVSVLVSPWSFGLR